MNPADSKSLSEDEMNQRISTLKQQTLNRPVTLSHERAVLVTDFYRSLNMPSRSVPVQRSLCLKHILENKSIYIEPDELIAGERGERPKAVPAYPEICLHSLADLHILDSRPKIPYRVSPQTKEIYKKEIIPFWKGKTIRDKIFSNMDRSWKTAFKAGIFTEFQEQRSPGHTAGGDLIYHNGFLDLKKQIKKRIGNLDFFHDPLALDKKEVLTSLDIAADALISFAERHALALEKLAARETSPSRKKELEQMARICHKVPAHKPDTFYEALQYYWFVHIGVITELNPWDAYNPGRFDQNLYPFYKNDIENGVMTQKQAKELLCCLWIKFHNHPAPPKVGITARESNTYVDFCLINLGGVTPDNRDGVNELTYLTLDVIEEMRLLQPSSMIQVSKKNPDRFIKRALKIIATGFGQPSVFNTDAIIQEMILQGKTMEDARKSGASGCVEAGAFGTESYILTGYFNLPKVLEITLHNGVDPRTGKKTGIKTGDPASFKSFDDLFNAFNKQLAHFIDIKIKGNNVIEQINARFMPVPLLSLVTQDCIENAMDYNQGGARYNTSYIQGVGLGSVTDALSALNHLVYEEKSVSMERMISAMKNDFNNGDILCHQMDTAPKYGNDDKGADTILHRVFQAYHDCISGRPNHRGGRFRINLLPTTCHVYFGEVTGAMPDGRKAGKPLSEGISPVQGADRNGPTAVLNSAARIDHLKTGGTLLNQKFLPDLLKDEKGMTSLVHLIRSYFKMDGHHVQFNVVDKATLQDAKKHPEKHKDLIVRVAGYSDYFVDLTPELQDEIIERTGHRGF